MNKKNTDEHALYMERQGFVEIKLWVPIPKVTDFKIRAAQDRKDCRKSFGLVGPIEVTTGDLYSSDRDLKGS